MVLGEVGYVLLAEENGNYLQKQALGWQHFQTV